MSHHVGAHVHSLVKRCDKQDFHDASA